MIRTIDVNIYNDLSRENENSISVICTGDFGPLTELKLLAQEKKFDEIYGDYLEILRNKDLSISNLEVPITDEPNKIKKVGPSLKASSNELNILNHAGVDILTLANNHILDFGDQGLEDTLNNCKNANLKTVGASLELEEANIPLQINMKKKRVGIINFAEGEFSLANEYHGGANPYSLAKVIKKIRELRNSVETIIVIIHGGIEGYSLPSPDFAEELKLIAMEKPTVVICHHSHIYSGYEILDGVPIFYSLGNFLFDLNIEPNKVEYFINLKINPKGRTESFKIIPFKIDKNNCMQELNENEFEVFRDNLLYLNNVLTDPDKLYASFKKFSLENGINRLSHIITPNRYFRKLFRINFFYRIMMYMHNKLNIYGIINCPAHREVLTKYLSEKIHLQSSK